MSCCWLFIIQLTGWHQRPLCRAWPASHCPRAALSCIPSLWANTDLTSENTFILLSDKKSLVFSVFTVAMEAEVYPDIISVLLDCLRYRSRLRLRVGFRSLRRRKIVKPCLKFPSENEKGAATLYVSEQGLEDTTPSPKPSTSQFLFKSTP